MRDRADLHVHTTASDGTWSPTEAVPPAASRLSLGALAVTDHDTVAGVAEARAAAERSGIALLAGVELSAYDGRQPVHILGLLIEPTDGTLRSRLDGLRRERLHRAGEILRRLGELGYPLTWREVMAQAGDGTVGRPHIARALQARGYVRTAGEAFARLLGDGCPAGIPARTLHPREAVRWIHEAGGCAVVAHPGLLSVGGSLEELLAEVDGLEVWHPEHSASQVARLKALVEGAGLLATGGSDAHGPGAKRNASLGKACAPVEVVPALRERSRTYR